jgi:hypothetical protein
MANTDCESPLLEYLALLPDEPEPVRLGGLILVLVPAAVRPLSVQQSGLSLRPPLYPLLLLLHYLHRIILPVGLWIRRDGGLLRQDRRGLRRAEDEGAGGVLRVLLLNVLDVVLYLSLYRFRVLEKSK